ncbi:hypothetical protein PhAPEC5_30 [Escherichia phage vB_EcoP_PhAPEC5]|uniref:Uncharacterized protein n=1 Tax=Escherichia phage vB_EcoP_PhAPEC5 TaxID=1395983 RepID=A0A067Y191_9CAUD|nr:hypothetical protein LD33_gp33 [Escherichia phage vB_EcoP_PhAPEC5]AGV99312.1 hypothetical protein PhAPEC5_30 [Escherichia phage vB_EcoP_PhAPEC5]
MKRLAIQAMIISIILVLEFVFALHGAQSLEEMFFVVARYSACSIGLWCVYYYTRDYVAIKEHDDAKERLRQFVEENRK